MSEQGTFLEEGKKKFLKSRIVNTREAGGPVTETNRDTENDIERV